MEEIQRVTIADLQVDAVLTERPVESVELTKHPVEKGVSPADHARLQPAKISIEGILSNTLVNREEQIRRGGPSAPRESGAADTTASDLRNLLADRRAITIKTSRVDYKNMVMTSLEFPRDSRTGDAVRFAATFEEVVFVASSTSVLAPRTANPQKALGKKEQGKKVATTVPPEEEKQIRRTAAKFISDLTPLTNAGDGILNP